MKPVLPFPHPDDDAIEESMDAIRAVTDAVWGEGKSEITVIVRVPGMPGVWMVKSSDVEIEPRVVALLEEP